MSHWDPITPHNDLFSVTSHPISPPIVPFRETIVDPPEKDMVNEELNDENKIVSNKDDNAQEECHSDENENIAVMQTPNKQCSVSIRALPLPAETVSLLEINSDLLKYIDKNINRGRTDDVDNVMNNLISSLKDKINNSLNKSPHTELHNTIDKIWCFGPKRNGPNILINRTTNHLRSSLWGDVNENKCDSNNSKPNHLHECHLLVTSLFDSGSSDRYKIIREFTFKKRSGN